MSHSGISLTMLYNSLLHWVVDERRAQEDLQTLLLTVLEHEELDSLGPGTRAMVVDALDEATGGSDLLTARVLAASIASHLSASRARTISARPGPLLRYFRRLSQPIGISSSRRRKIMCPPGWTLYRFADFAFSRATVDAVLGPTICDFQHEYEQALSEGRKRKAEWVRLRGYWSFWSAVIAQLPISLAKRIYELWRAAG